MKLAMHWTHVSYAKLNANSACESFWYMRKLTY